MRLTIITAVSRPENLGKVGASIAEACVRCDGIDVMERRGLWVLWWRMFAASVPSATFTEHVQAAAELPFPCTSGRTSAVGAAGMVERNAVLDQITDGAACFLDDDNLMTPGYLQAMSQHLANHPGKAIIVDQVDAYGNVRCRAASENMRPCAIDTAQGCVPVDLIGDTRFVADAYEGDGAWYASLYAKAPERFVFIDQPHATYNVLR